MSENTSSHQLLPMTISAQTRFQVVQEIALKISTSLDIDEILNLIIDSVPAFISYDAAAIYILETDGKNQDKRIRAYVNRGYSSSEDLIKLKAGEGLVGWVVQHGPGIIIPDVRTDNRYVEANKNTLSEIITPIVTNGKTIGAFNLESNDINAYTEMDLEILTFFASTVAISIEKAFLHQELLEKKRLEGELSVARQVQLSLLPDKDPEIPGFDISGANFSSKEISGDYFDFIPFPNQQLGISIADVSGKGIPSALIMASFRASLRAQVRNDFAIRNIFRKVNYLLWESIASHQFVTAIYGVLDPETKQFTFSDAGHNPMLLLRPDNSYVEVSCGNTVLGVFEDREYKECNKKLKPGEILILYTDGVTEATRDGAELGVQGFVDILCTLKHLPACELIQGIYEAIRDYARQPVLEDDLTLIIVKILLDENI